MYSRSAAATRRIAAPVQTSNNRPAGRAALSATGALNAICRADKSRIMRVHPRWGTDQIRDATADATRATTSEQMRAPSRRCSPGRREYAARRYPFLAVGYMSYGGKSALGSSEHGPSAPVPDEDAASARFRSPRVLEREARKSFRKNRGQRLLGAEVQYFQAHDRQWFAPHSRSARIYSLDHKH